MVNTYHAFDVITPFHAISSLSYCFSLAATDDVVTLHIVPAMNGRYLMEEGHFVAATGVQVELVHQTRRSSGRKVLECLLRRCLPGGGSDAKAALFIGHHTYFKPTVLRYLGESLSGRRIRTFAFEEGVGSYHSLAQELEVASREGKRFPISKYVLKKLLASRALIDQHWGLLSSKDSEIMRHWYQVAAAELANHLYVNEGVDVAGEHNDGVLFFTSPLVRLGLLQAQENEALVVKVREFFRQRGQTLYIKPHPLDQQAYEHLVTPGCVVDTLAPAEVYLMQHRYAGVAAINSGALLTASMMYNLNATNFHAWLPDSAREKLTLAPALCALFARYTVDCEEVLADNAAG